MITAYHALYNETQCPGHISLKNQKKNKKLCLNNIFIYNILLTQKEMLPLFVRHFWCLLNVNVNIILYFLLLYNPLKTPQIVFSQHHCFSFI